MKLLQIDAFTAVPFKGNPAAVCLLDSSADEDWMQKVGAEMNLAETAFVKQAEDGFDLRWFTPVKEVDLCGHATLASAHALWETGLVEAVTTIRFHTRSGLLTASKKGDWIELDFPAIPSRPVDSPAGLEDALGAPPAALLEHEFGYLARFDSERAIRDLRPDFALLRDIPAEAFIVTSPSLSDEFDFISRMFAPSMGIDEDPVTGSAHCCLGPYWMGQLGKKNFVAYQVSARGGVVKVQVGEGRVYLQGQAVTVLRGDLLS